MYFFLIWLQGIFKYNVYVCIYKVQNVHCSYSIPHPPICRRGNIVLCNPPFPPLQFFFPIDTFCPKQLFFRLLWTPSIQIIQLFSLHTIKSLCVLTSPTENIPKNFFICVSSLTKDVGSARWHARTNLTPSLYCVHIWLRARQIGLSTWVEPYKSDSGQFCLSHNRIKYELKHFFQLIFDHNYLYLYIYPSLQTKYIPLFSLYDSITFN